MEDHRDEKSIAIFQTAKINKTLPTGFVEDQPAPRCKDLAEYLMEQFKHLKTKITC